MPAQTPIPAKSGFCIYIDTFCQGLVPVVRDGTGNFIVFDSLLEAQKEIVDAQLIKVEQFLAGERDFDDAITVEEFAVPVDVLPDGTIVDEWGQRFETDSF